MSQGPTDSTSLKDNVSSTPTSQIQAQTDTKIDDEKMSVPADLKLTLTYTAEYDQWCYQDPSENFLFMTSIKGPYFRAIAEKRAPVDIMCVVDESSSMSGVRIELVKQTIEFIIKNLESTDRFGCCGYSSTARRILELTPMDPDGKKRALEQVKAITASGQTALCDGLLLGLQMMRERKTESSSVASCMLFTDGQANVGLRSAREIVKATMKAKANAKPTKPKIVKEGQAMEAMESLPIVEDTKVRQEVMHNNQLPCTINTFGFGEGHNETLLEAIAEHGRGMYVYIKNAEMISETFAECLGGLVSVVAQDLKIRVSVKNGVRINRCLSVGFDMKAIRPNEIYEICITDLQSEENRDLLFSLTIPAIEEVRQNWPIADVTMEYQNTVVNKIENLAASASIGRLEEKERGERNYAVDLQHNRLIAAQAMDEADQLADKGKIEEARKALKTAQDVISSSPSKRDNYSVNLVKDIQKCSDGLRSEREYRSHGSKSLKMNRSSHMTQRSSHSPYWLSQSTYSTPSKAAMLNRLKNNKQ